jgi:hypothetical protein
LLKIVEDEIRKTNQRGGIREMGEEEKEKEGGSRSLRRGKVSGPTYRLSRCTTSQLHRSVSAG